MEVVTTSKSLPRNRNFPVKFACGCALPSPIYASQDNRPMGRAYHGSTRFARGKSDDFPENLLPVKVEQPYTIGQIIATRKLAHCERGGGRDVGIRHVRLGHDHRCRIGVGCPTLCGEFARKGHRGQNKAMSLLFKNNPRHSRLLSKRRGLRLWQGRTVRPCET